MVFERNFFQHFSTWQQNEEKASTTKLSSLIIHSVFFLAFSRRPFLLPVASTRKKIVSRLRFSPQTYLKIHPSEKLKYFFSRCRRRRRIPWFRSHSRYISSIWIHRRWTNCYLTVVTQIASHPYVFFCFALLLSFIQWVRRDWKLFSVVFFGVQIVPGSIFSLPDISRQ